MAKKITTFTPRVSAKSKLGTYKKAAFEYINTLLRPKRQEAFSVAGYEVTPTGKKPNGVSAPELLAIVGTAAKLGKSVEVAVVGSEDGGRLTFYFVDRPSPMIPAYLY